MQIYDLLVGENAASLQQRREALEDKLDIAKKQLEEFHSSSHLLELGLVDDLDINGYAAREMRRLENALPFYGFRSEVARQVHSSNVTIIIG